MALGRQRGYQIKRPEPPGILGSIFRIFIVLAFFSLIVGSTLYGYIENLRIVLIPILGIGFNVYGVYTLIHLGLQMVFARQNVRKIAIRRKANGLFTPTVGSSSVGAREDPELFSLNVRSLRKQNYPQYKEGVFVSDGNSSVADEAMARAFISEVGNEGELIRLDFVLWEALEQTVADYLHIPRRRLRMKHWRRLANEFHVRTPWEALEALLKIRQCPQRDQLYNTLRRLRLRNGKLKYFMIMQPHRDKRHALWTSMYLLLDFFKVEIIPCTDSDTEFKNDAISELVKVFSLGHTGGASGDVKILKPSNWLSFLSSLRYVLANNLERAGQSRWNSVNCLSGPNSCYASDALKQIILEWMMQRLFGVRTTFGDDRSLTNKLLKYGWEVNYTPHAICETETPTNFIRWFLQQLRWSRSFFREALLNLVWMFRVRHLFWLTYDVTYQMMFPFLLTTGIIIEIAIAFQMRNPIHLLFWVATIIVQGLLRGIFGFFITKKLRMLLFPLYSLLVVPLLFARIYAFFTVWYTGWGGKARGVIGRSNRDEYHGEIMP